MPKKYFIIELSDGAEIHVLFETANGMILSFVVKLALKLNNNYYEVVRFDSGHECPHKDILEVNGQVKRKVWFKLLDNEQGKDI